jgi:hypothetical protein
MVLFSRKDQESLKVLMVLFSLKDQESWRGAGSMALMLWLD